MFFRIPYRLCIDVYTYRYVSMSVCSRGMEKNYKRKMEWEEEKKAAQN